MKLKLLVALLSILLAQTAGAQAPAGGSKDVRIYIDPVTGQPGEPPPGATLGVPSTPASGRAATLPDSAKIRPGTTKAGGVILDLSDRPPEELRVTNGPDGPRTSCKQQTTPGSER